jgi:phage-related protein
LESPPLKPVIWVGSSFKDLQSFPRTVQREIGRALLYAQLGGKHPDAEPLRGFGGASVVEIIERHDGATYRAVYTVRFAGRVYVLHAFQKKSKKGISTPKHELDLIRARLKAAEEMQRRFQEEP